MILVLLKGLGEDRLPEWQVGDPALHQELTQLAAGGEVAEEEEPAESSMEVILADWQPAYQQAVIKVPETSVIKPGFPSLLSKDSVQLDSDDDDEDDDDLPAYDMSHDVRLPAKDAPRLRYLRDILDHLGEGGDTSDPEACFRVLPVLCEKQLAHEDPAVVSDLLGVMLFAENRFDTTLWFSLRQDSRIYCLNWDQFDIK